MELETEEPRLGITPDAKEQRLIKLIKLAFLLCLITGPHMELLPFLPLDGTGRKRLSGILHRRALSLKW